MLLRVAVWTLKRSLLDGLVKACMHSLSFYVIVHQGGRSVAECGPVAKVIGGVVGLSMYITHNSGRSAYLPMVTVSFWCSGRSSNDVTTRLAEVSARSLPLMFVCPLILCSIVGTPILILYCSEVTMAVVSGLWWW